MVSIIVLCLVVLVAAAASVPGPDSGDWRPTAGANPWFPPWVAASYWKPRWTKCEPTVRGSTCQDCTTRIVCTKVGGLIRACTDPALPHCNLGQCSATPSANCAVPVLPATKP